MIFVGFVIALVFLGVVATIRGIQFKNWWIASFGILVLLASAFVTLMPFALSHCGPCP